MSARLGLLARALLASGILASLGCAVPQPAALDSEQLRESERAVRENIRRQRGRLYGIAYTLRAAGAKLCPPELLQPDPGVLLEIADKDSSLAGLEVVFVAPRSSLALAGVQAGDVLLELDGQGATTVKELNKSLSVARAQLKLQRRGEPYQVDAGFTSVCTVPVDLSADAGLMTFLQDGKVSVPYGLLEAAGDDWLAIAIAHQIVHALLELSTERIDDREARADRLGLLLAAEAGFDVGTAPAFWEWLASENPWRIASTRAFRIPRPHPTLETATEYPTSQLHVGIARRLPAIRATVEEIRLQARAR